MNRVMILAAAVLLAGCGDGLVFNGGQSDAGGGGNSGTTTSTSSSGGGAAQGGAGQGGSAQGGNSAGGAGQGGAAQGGAGQGGSAQGGNGPGAGGGGQGGGGQGGSSNLPPLECGMDLCPAGPKSACCFDSYNQTNGPELECVTGNASNDGCDTLNETGFETRIECQSNAQCSGAEICCADREFVMNGGQQLSIYVETSCQTSCDYPDIVLCDQVGSTVGCPLLPQQGGEIQGVCQQSSLLPTGYLVCAYP